MDLRLIRSLQKPLDMSPPPLEWTPPNDDGAKEDDEEGTALRPNIGMAAGMGAAL